MEEKVIEEGYYKIRRKKGRELLDDSSFEILSAFKEGNFIVDGKKIPMSLFK